MAKKKKSGLLKKIFVWLFFRASPVPEGTSAGASDRPGGSKAHPRAKPIIQIRGGHSPIE